MLIFINIAWEESYMIKRYISIIFIKLIISIILCFLLFYTITSLFISHIEKSVDSPLGKSKPKKSLLVYSDEGYFNDSMDEYGFNNNSFENKALPYIIFNGDSYTEAIQVNRSSNYVSLVNETFSEYNCFNYGKSGNSIADYIYNAELPKKQFDIAFNFIQVKQYDFTTDSQREDKNIYIDNDNDHFVIKTREINKGKLETVISKYSGTVYPFFRYSFLQLQNVIKPKAKNNINNTSVKKRVFGKNDKRLIDWELEQLKNKYGNNISFIYISDYPVVSKNGIVFSGDEYYYDFENYLFDKCKEWDIDIIDTSDAFADFYKNTKQLPTGFNNTRPGSGHINQYAHKIIAGLVNQYIKDNMEINK